ncbi:hypothetical protein VTI74DRAFT_2725 [Chaetomium olivicolor]
MHGQQCCMMRSLIDNWQIEVRHRIPNTSATPENPSLLLRRGVRGGMEDVTPQHSSTLVRRLFRSTLLELGPYN